MIAAVVPAAGRSRRMGRPKALLPLGPELAVERLLGTLDAAGVDRVLAVVHEDGPPLLAATLEAFGARVVGVSDPSKGMFASIRAGVAALAEGGCEAFLVHPVDLPLVEVATVSAIVEAGRGRPGPFVIKPRLGTRRGHPPLLSGDLVAPLLSWKGEGGLRAFLRREGNGPVDGVELPVEDDGVLLDLDTPADHREALRRVAAEALPTPSDEERLWAELGGNAAGLRAHGRAVERVALALLGAVERGGRREDEDGRLFDGGRLATAARLHDLAKGLPRHDREGARRLRREGWHGVAALVGAHVNLPPSSRARVDERSLLHLADRCVRGEALVEPMARFDEKARRFAGDGAARDAVERRRVVAREIVEALARDGIDLHGVLEGLGRS